MQFGIKNDIYDNLSSVPRDKTLAIWGLHTESMQVLIKAINARLQIEYFVDDLGNYTGAPLFDKKIITREKILEDVQIFVLLIREQYEAEKDWIDQYLQGRFYIIDLYNINSSIRNKGSVYIYGAGENGKRTLMLLLEQGMEIKGFIDSDQTKVGRIKSNYPIYDINVLDKEDVVIISSLYCKEIYNRVSQWLDDSHIYIDYRNSALNSVRMFKGDEDIYVEWEKGITAIHGITLFFTIWADFVNKQIILYGMNEIAEQLIAIFDLLGVKVAYIVDNDINQHIFAGYETKNIYDLMYENLDGKIIIVIKYDSKANTPNSLIMDRAKALAELGLKYFHQYRILTNGVAYSFGEQVTDHLLGYTINSTKTSLEYPGFCLYRKEQNSKKKIVVLGGSTSAELYENVVTSWPEYFQNKCEDVIIYNGAIPAYHSHHECLKLLRDVANIQPDLVISYSGINDKACSGNSDFPFSGDDRLLYKDNICYGVKSNKKMSEHWLTMERYMKAICDVNGSRFLSVLQPALTVKKTTALSPEEKRVQLIYDKDGLCESNRFRRDMREYLEFVHEVKDKIDDYPWMYDFTEIFDDTTETVYKDECHVTDLGNRIIAEKIYDVINTDYFRLGTEE